ncbi:MAG TPA: sigma-70 family RNA polymerase sigma factor [Vicinamibacterales bacterium]
MVPVSNERLLLQHLDMVDRVVGFVCRRHHLSYTETEDFASSVRLKLVENDYEVLRKFEGRSNLQTYLTVVIQRLFLDFRITTWGRWRPSAEAKRLGPTAVLLERLTSRDDIGLDEACEMLRANHGVRHSDQELRDLAAKLPVRLKRQRVGEEALSEIANPVERTEFDALRAAYACAATRTGAALAAAIGALPPEDRLVLKLRFEDNLHVSEIARVLDVDQKPLYRRIEALLRALRTRLESQGIRRDEISDWLGSPAVEVPRAPRAAV